MVNRDWDVYIYDCISRDRTIYAKAWLFPSQRENTFFWQSCLCLSNIFIFITIQFNIKLEGGKRREFYNNKLEGANCRNISNPRARNARKNWKARKKRKAKYAKTIVLQAKHPKSRSKPTGDQVVQKMFLNKCSPKVSRVGPELEFDSSKAPKGLPKAPQRFPRQRGWRAQGGPQGILGAPKGFPGTSWEPPQGRPGRDLAPKPFQARICLDLGSFFGRFWKDVWSNSHGFTTKFNIFWMPFLVEFPNGFVHLLFNKMSNH